MTCFVLFCLEEIPALVDLVDGGELPCERRYDYSGNTSDHILMNQNQTSETLVGIPFSDSWDELEIITLQTQLPQPTMC